MIEKIGIIGAGQMGTGIAHVCSLAKLDVKLIDINEAQIDKALETISKNMGRQIKKGAISEADRTAALARIHPSKSYQDLKDCDFVVEAATEKETVKKEIMKAVSRC